MSLKGHQLEVLWSRPLPTPELCKTADAARLSAPPCWPSVSEKEPWPHLLLVSLPHMQRRQA